jgi:hypothetical protein
MNLNLIPFAEINRLKRQRNWAYGILAIVVICGVWYYHLEKENEKYKK